ncbi:hypothetical protein GEMRC1_002336 [Eukaryota sp. GEM-RC1]
MPTISIARDTLFTLLGKTFTKEQFEDLCFEFGIELDEETTEAQLSASARNEATNQSSPDETVIYRIEVPANRIDLLCVEGLAKALRTFMYENEPPASYKPSSLEPLDIYVKSSTSSIRPYIVGAVLHDFSFTPEVYKSFIDLQDKLHQNYCRKRKLVAIGTHDLDTIEAPFVYSADDTNNISFAALNSTEEKTASEILDAFDQPGHYLRPYLSIISDRSRHPVIYDNQSRVLSLPPIINGNHSKITLNTRNILIECTAIDRTKAYDVLDTIISMFSSLCKNSCEFRQVKVHYPDGNVDVTPRMASREMTVNVNDISQMIGVTVGDDEAVSLLRKMMLPAKIIENFKISVAIPPTRNDILHPCDVVEDAAIAFGFDKIPKKLPEFMTFGDELPSTETVELLRSSIAGYGFTEICTFTLLSKFDTADWLDRPDDGVIVANPKGHDFERVRNSLIPGLLKTAGHNKGIARPLRLFEIGDVVLVDNQDENGSINEKRLGALYSSVTAGFEYLHGLVDRFSSWMGIKPEFLKLVESDIGYLIKGHQAHIVYTGGDKDVVVGEVGSVAIQVIKNFDVSFPCSVLEINLSKIMELGL